MTTQNTPVVVLTLGDAAGIGPELIAHLLSQPGITGAANIVLLGDPWLWRLPARNAIRSCPTSRPWPKPG